MVGTFLNPEGEPVSVAIDRPKDREPCKTSRYRWTNFPCPRKRRGLRSSVEGSAVSPADQQTTATPPGSNQHLRLDDERPHRRRSKESPQRWSPYTPRPHGPVTRVAATGSPPPTCIHCGGPTTIAGRSTYAVHLTTSVTTWICRDMRCLGRDDAVIIKTPMGEYERRC